MEGSLSKLIKKPAKGRLSNKEIMKIREQEKIEKNQRERAEAQKQQEFVLFEDPRLTKKKKITPIPTEKSKEEEEEDKPDPLYNKVNFRGFEEK